MNARSKARTLWLAPCTSAGCRCLTKGHCGLKLLYMSASESPGGGATPKSFLKRTKRFGCTQLSIRLATSKPLHLCPLSPRSTLSASEMHSFSLFSSNPSSVLSTILSYTLTCKLLKELS
ncbi:hypothetical protein E2C01_028764 [Portunus trituberculatus]|uniref:Uncharacterized protein n=1 Tax=Portunus trituberculatus TaxID=210409 RepID=A0A5B7EQW5_PORTR|nr:hypothetical protein [Portunus trituberculatus]